MQQSHDPVWRTDLMVEDMTKRGWLQADLATRAFPKAGGSAARMRVSRFLTGERQTPRTAKAIARALGHPVDRYLVTREAVA